MNIGDIARLANVSKATVSRVINNTCYVNDEIKEKVESVIKKHNYKPNNLAKALAGKASKIIGIFYTDITDKEENISIANSPFLSEFLIYATDIAETLGYHVLIFLINKEEKISEIETLFQTRYISAAIVLGNNIFEEEIKKLTAKGFNIAVFNHPISIDSPNLLSVKIDNEYGAYLATDNLIQKGHKHIAHITGNEKKATVLERYNGMKACLKKYDLYIPQELVYYGNLHREQSGYDNTDLLIEQNISNLPTAIFYASDILMIGGTKAIYDKGLKIPDDISVIGFDNITACRYFHPLLSSISYSIVDIVSYIIKHLDLMINKQVVDSQPYIIKDLELVERDSVKRIN